MIIRTDNFKDVCNKILSAVDSNQISIITETLEIKCENNICTLSVTNREYFVQVNFEAGTEEAFHATVNATLFLKLVSQITTDCIELLVENNSLIVKANGNYKLPLIYDNEKLLELPVITIENPITTFNISKDILDSILTFNSKELTKGTAAKPVQNLYYIDKEGAITFRSTACVNSFSLPEDIKILINDRIVKLFKLFKTDTIQFTLGYDAVGEDIIQTKVKFISDNITLTAIISSDDSMINSVPVKAIRGRANNIYPYSVTVNKDALLQTINRLLLFNLNNKDNIKLYSTFEFDKENMTVYDTTKVNKEQLNYIGSSINCEEPYSAILDLMDLKPILESCSEQYIMINFGDNVGVVLARGNIRNVIPEIHAV